MRSINRAPIGHALIRVVEAGATAVAVSGVITTPATARGLLTGTPCALATTSVTASDPTWPGWPHPLWLWTSTSDLQVRYDAEIVTRPKRVTRQPGTLPVRASQIAVAMPVGRMSTFPVDAATLARLTAAGLPATVRATIEADPTRFEVAEHVLLPGDVVHLASDPQPDPRQEPRFLLSPGGQRFMAAGAGIFVFLFLPVLLFGLACAAAVAYLLIVG
jgi:hypothetical protein